MTFKVANAGDRSMQLPVDEKWAYALGLLATAVTWHVTQLTQEIRSTHAVAYSISADSLGQSEEIVLENVSTQRSVIDLPVQLQCPRHVDASTGQATIKPCMGEDDLSLISYPPTMAPSIGMVEGVVPMHNFTVSIAAGGKFGIALKCRQGLGCPEFYILPSEGKSTDVTLIARDSLRGFFVANYFNITIASLIMIFVALLMVLVISFVVPKLRAGRSLGTGAARRAFLRKRLERRR